MAGANLIPGQDCSGAQGPMDPADPSQPASATLGTDSAPWMTSDQIAQALAAPAGGGGANMTDAPFGPSPINMNVNQFLQLDGPVGGPSRSRSGRAAAAPASPSLGTTACQSRS